MDTANAKIIAGALLSSSLNICIFLTKMKTTLNTIAKATITAHAGTGVLPSKETSLPKNPPTSPRGSILSGANPVIVGLIEATIKNANKDTKSKIEYLLYNSLFSINYLKDILYINLVNMTNLRSTLKNKLRQEEIPKSFDIIGSIAIFSKFPSNLKKQKLIANTILKLNKNIKTVLLKTNKVSGIYRLPKYKHLAGIKTKETSYKENSCLFKLDVEKCYFSPRLSSERLRIAKQVKFNETILVMFSGVGTFSLVISKNSKAKGIYSIEINPIAVEYARENLKLNKVTNVKLFMGNVKKIMPKMKHKFDRIVMPAPKNAENYLSLIKSKIKKNTVIHYYDFCNEKDFPDKIINKIKRYFKKIKISKIVKCGNVSPYNYRICVDFQVL